MAIVERNDWPGNVRRLDAVVKRAMVRRRRGWVRPQDILLPKLRRAQVPLPGASLSLGIQLTPMQSERFVLTATRGVLRRRDLMGKPHRGTERGDTDK
jgi:transcriptional regulator of aromatic amino acid metabolism